MSDTCDLTTYDEVADLVEQLPTLVREKRRRERLSLRTAAEQLGVAASTLAGFEARERGIATDSLVALFRWLGEDGGTDR